MEEALFQNYTRLLDATDSTHYRYLYNEIDWDNRLIGITGSRGTGKTTMILQHIKATFADRRKALYVSLDNIWFTKNSLLELADEFYAFGGTHLFIDEVHRYPNWSIEIKNIYDSYPALHIVYLRVRLFLKYINRMPICQGGLSVIIYTDSLSENF